MISMLALSLARNPSARPTAAPEPVVPESSRIFAPSGNFLLNSSAARSPSNTISEPMCEAYRDLSALTLRSTMMTGIPAFLASVKTASQPSSTTGGGAPTQDLEDSPVARAVAPLGVLVRVLPPHRSRAGGGRALHAPHHRDQRDSRGRGRDLRTCSHPLQLETPCGALGACAAPGPHPVGRHGSRVPRDAAPRGSKPGDGSRATPVPAS